MADKAEPRIVDRAARNKATNWTAKAEGPPDEAAANNGRPNDLPIVTPDPALPNSTLASRAKARTKQVDVDKAEDKSIQSASKKS